VAKGIWGDENLLATPAREPYRAGLAVPVQNGLPQGTKQKGESGRCVSPSREAPGSRPVPPPPLGLLGQALPLHPLEGDESPCQRFYE